MRNNPESDSTLMSKRYSAHISVEVDSNGRPSDARTWRAPVSPSAARPSRRSRGAGRRNKR